MIRLFAAVFITLSMTFAAAAQDDPGVAIKDTIQSQIDAFKVDDFAAAFEFASPSIRMMFRTPENFGTMVRNGFPMVWRPDSVRYGGLSTHAGSLWQEVTITDQDGVQHALAYRMEPSENGWKIAGVIILEAPDLSA